MVFVFNLGQTVAEVVGYDAALVFDESKPEGIPWKLMDSPWLHALGWNNVRSLKDGIRSTYEGVLRGGF